MCNSYTLQLAITISFPVLLLSDNLWTKIDRSKFPVMNIELKWYATTLYWTMAVNLWKRRLLRLKHLIPYTWRCKVSVFDLRNIPVDSLPFYIFFSKYDYHPKIFCVVFGKQRRLYLCMLLFRTDISTHLTMFSHHHDRWSAPCNMAIAMHHTFVFRVDFTSGVVASAPYSH